MKAVNGSAAARGRWAGGRRAAILANFTNTCRRHDIDVQRYLTKLLTNLPDAPMSGLDDWLPDRWKATNPAPTPAAGV